MWKGLLSEWNLTIIIKKIAGQRCSSPLNECLVMIKVLTIWVPSNRPNLITFYKYFQFPNCSMSQPWKLEIKCEFSIFLLWQPCQLESLQNLSKLYQIYEFDSGVVQKSSLVYEAKTPAEHWRPLGRRAEHCLGQLW